MEEKVSVLITFYNQEKYVDDCLSSVFAQHTTFSFVVIVGDDGSSDLTLNKVLKWEKQYPTKLRHIIQDRNPDEKYVGGVRASKNRLSLIKEVKTPYFIFLDGDDYWISNDKLQKQVDLLEMEENSDCEACAHYVNSFNEDKPEEEPSVIPARKLKEGKIPFQIYWEDMYFHTDSILFRSRHIPDLDFMLLENHFNDNVITFCFLRFGSVYFIPETMATYRKNMNGIYTGDKFAVGMLRDIFDYDITVKMMPNIKPVSRRRHLHDFMFVQGHRKEMTSLDSYKQIAIKDNLPTSLRIVNTGFCFVNNDFGDRLYIIMVRLQRQIIIRWRKLFGIQ